jgi:hypothetical protein
MQTQVLDCAVETPCIAAAAARPSLPAERSTAVAVTGAESGMAARWGRSVASILPKSVRLGPLSAGLNSAQAKAKTILVPPLTLPRPPNLSIRSSFLLAQVYGHGEGGGGFGNPRKWI